MKIKLRKHLISFITQGTGSLIFGHAFYLYESLTQKAINDSLPDLVDHINKENPSRQVQDIQILNILPLNEYVEEEVEDEREGGS